VNLPRFTGQLDKAISPSKKKGGEIAKDILSLKGWDVKRLSFLQIEEKLLKSIDFD
jgi:hypothetical protein